MTLEMRMALAVAALFRDTPGKPRGTLARPDQRARMVDRIKDLPPEERGDPLNVLAIRAMLPTWRAWGQVLVDAGHDAPTTTKPW